MLKILIKIGLILAVLTAISVIIPDNFTTAIDESIVWFLVQMKNADMFIDTAVVLTCLKTLLNFALGLGVFWFFDWILEHTK